MVAGPAGRALPQLPLELGPGGELRAAGGVLRADRPVLVGRAQVSERELLRFFDERASTNRPLRKALRYVFPDHWSFMLGELALYSFIVLVATGIFLALFFEPSLRSEGLRRSVRTAARPRDHRGLRQRAVGSRSRSRRAC